MSLLNNLINGISLGSVSSFVLYSRKFSGPINEFANIISELQSALAAAERVFQLLDEAEEAPDAPGARELSGVRGAVALRGVRFGLLLALAARTEHERQLVRVHVQVRHRLVRVRIGDRGVEELALAAHTPPLAGRHRQGAREQARNARQENDMRLHACGRHAQHEGQV